MYREGSQQKTLNERGSQAINKVKFEYTKQVLASRDRVRIPASWVIISRTMTVVTGF